jgi:hypothetical protein
MTTQIYHQIELKFWQIIIPQLTPKKPLGRFLRKASQVKISFPLLRFGLIALTGSIVGTLGGVFLFSLFS